MQSWKNTLSWANKIWAKILGLLGVRWSQTHTQGSFGISPKEGRLSLLKLTATAAAAAADIGIKISGGQGMLNATQKKTQKHSFIWLVSWKTPSWQNKVFTYVSGQREKNELGISSWQRIGLLLHDDLINQIFNCIKTDWPMFVWELGNKAGTCGTHCMRANSVIGFSPWLLFADDFTK